MKLVLTALILMLATQAHALTNEEARADLAQLFFGDAVKKNEHTAVIDGVKDDGQPCQLQMRRSRYGVYAEILTPAPQGGFYVTSSGITDSDFTTTDLVYDRDDAKGLIAIKRHSVTGINERGQDDGLETVKITYSVKAGRGVPVKFEMTYQALDVDYDKDSNPIYTPTADPLARTSCTAK